MMNSYGYIYDALNGDDQVVTSSNFYWDDEKDIYYVKDKRYRKVFPDKEVFGWHPYWMGDSWKTILLNCCLLYPIFHIKLIQ